MTASKDGTQPSLVLRSFGKSSNKLRRAGFPLFPVDPEALEGVTPSMKPYKCAKAHYLLRRLDISTSFLATNKITLTKKSSKGRSGCFRNLLGIQWKIGRARHSLALLLLTPQSPSDGWVNGGMEVFWLTPPWKKNLINEENKTINRIKNLEC